MAYSANPVRPDLGAQALNYDPSMDGFIANMILPVWDAPAMEGSFEVIGTEVMLQQITDLERRPHADFKKTQYGKTRDFYRCEEFGIRGAIDKIEELTPERYNAEEQRLARRLMRIVNLDRERRVANLTINSTSYANGSGRGVNVSAVWSGAGTPLSDLFTACEAVKDACGMWPNRVEMTRKQIWEFSNNSEVSSRLNTVSDQPGMLPLTTIQNLTGIERVVIADSPYNTAPGGAAASVGNIWPDTKVLVWYAREDDDIESPQLGRTMAYDFGLGGGMGITVEYPPHPRMREFAHFQTVDEKIRTLGAAYVLHNVLS